MSNDIANKRIASETAIRIAKAAVDAYIETDPEFSSSPAHGISSGDIVNWNTIYSGITPFRSINSIRTLDSTDSQIECTANTFDVTLPTAVGIKGKVYSIKNTGTGVITIKTTSSQTIDGESTQTLEQWENITLMSNDANWIIL